ncbi:hypothetical protein J5TS2_34300 [Brevibacillus halotolerans]|nr:hypothetical protein J5TS2_34300 [Brevibacillus halotolerans]
MYLLIVNVKAYRIDFFHKNETSCKEEIMNDIACDTMRKNIGMVGVEHEVYENAWDRQRLRIC